MTYLSIKTITTLKRETRIYSASSEKKAVHSWMAFFFGLIDPLMTSMKRKQVWSDVEAKKENPEYHYYANIQKPALIANDDKENFSAPLLENITITTYVGNERRCYVRARCNEIRHADFEVILLQMQEVSGIDLTAQRPELRSYLLPSSCRLRSLIEASEFLSQWATTYFENNAPRYR